MNRYLLRKYINKYKADFFRIHQLEIYKWQAVKQFQDSWNPNASDFAEMLATSLSKTKNLLAAANYWPLRMLLSYAQKDPQKVGGLLISLFDEDIDVLERISTFQAGIAEINDGLHPGKNTYQDDRAVLVYLNLRYPDEYFLYKYTMFKSFCDKVEYGYKPKLRAKSENVIQYLNLCIMIREDLLADNELLKLHEERIQETEYLDAGNILTQDFIHAVARHLSVRGEPVPPKSSRLTLTQINPVVSQKQYLFKGHYIDHPSHQKRSKHIGDLGEQIVLQHEMKRCPPHLVDKIVHSAKSEGDGLGFDILSCDEEGREKYIEVKTTKGDASNTFHISGTELERSKKEGDRYFLYRLYNLDEYNMTADFFIIQGDLSEYCINPTEYEVTLKK